MLGVVSTNWVDDSFWWVGGVYIAHFAMYAILENRTHVKSGHACATQVICIALSWILH
jgi:hypothetical protein